MGVATGEPRPTVIFVDDHGWHSFDQVAAALGRRGVHTVRVALRPQPKPFNVGAEPPFRWLANHLFYDECVVLSSDGGRARLERILREARIVDVIATEPALLAIGLGSPIARELTSRSLAFRALDPEILLDKFAVNLRLAAAGVETPQQIRVADLAPAAAVRRLGLPIVVKSPIGAAGEAVRVARSLAELKRVVQELGGPAAGLFYQEFVEGDVLLYCAVIGPEGPMMEHGFRVEEAQYDLGPSAVVAIDDAPALLAAGARAAELFGCRGFVSFGFLRSPDGRLLHIDANFRVWGMIMAPARLGIDFTRPYANLIAGRTWRRPRARATGADAPMPVLPYAFFDAATRGASDRARELAWPMLATFWPTAGPAYCLHAALCAGLLAVRGARDPARRARRRRAGSPPAPPAQAADEAALGSGGAAGPTAPGLA